MQNFHDKLMEKDGAYAKWHKHPGHKPIQWLFLVLVISLFSSLIYNRLKQDSSYGLFSLASGTTIVVPTGSDPLVNGDNFQIALDTAVCGDTIVLQAGAEYGTRVTFVNSYGPIGYPFYLRNKGDCAGSYITIQTSNLGGLPAEGTRVSPSHAAAMPKVVSYTGSPAIEAATYANYYKLVGLEFTNSPTVASQGGHTNTLLGGPSYNPIGSHPHHITVDRSFFHPIEDTTNPSSDYRSATRGVHIDGAEIVVQNSYLSGFTGWYWNTTTPIDSEAVIMVSGPGPLRLFNNFLEAWYNNVFTGGGGAPTANTATLASGTTATQATFILNPGAVLPAIGDLVAFQMPTTATCQPSGFAPPGEVWCVGQVTGISGNTVSYMDVGGSGINSAPATPGLAKWNGQVISDVEIRRNTFNKRVGWEKYGQCKSFYEVKMAVGLTIDGNIFLDGPGGCNAVGIVSGNQTGATPWTMVTDVVISNNLFYHTGNLTTTFTTYSTNLEGGNVVVSNNLIYGDSVPYLSTHASSPYMFVQTTGGFNVTYRHNTVRGNTNSMLFGGGAAQRDVVFSDNLTNSGNYWFNCTNDGQLNTCWPGMNQQKNVMINTSGGSPPSYTSSDFVAANDAAVGFQNLSACDSGSDYHGCALSASSPYKGMASDGKDPGVDFAALDAALAGSTPTPSPTLSFSASPLSITQGQSSTLSWSSTNVSSCSASGAWSGAKALSGSESVSPAVTSTYTLTCTGTAGSVSKSTTITVSPPSDTTPPSAPTSLTGLTSSVPSVALSWSPSTDNVGVTGYNIYRGGVQIGTSASTSYTDSAVAFSTTYSYFVKAYDAAGNVSLSSNTISVTTPPSTPSTPISIGSRVKTTVKLKVRQTPTTRGKALCTQPVGALGTVISGPQTAGGYTWWQVNYDSSCDGWSVENYLVVVP